jgi:nucleoside-diphosphate-sugar epimerase
MRITIFGASGKTGKLLVEEALGAGYDVNAFVRNPSKLALSHNQLTCIKGDATDPAAVERAIQGTNAVICILNSSHLICITQNILNSMKLLGVNRLIITSAGIPQPPDRPDFRFGLLLGIGKFVRPQAVEDTIHSAQLVKSSGLDWTIFRMVPTNGKPTAQVNADYIKREIKVFISRADAAMYILKELRDNNWIRQAPVIFNT